MKKDQLPTDDSEKSVLYRINRVNNGDYPPMPRLHKMTRKEMASHLQSIWTLLDERGIQRRNETCPQTHLGIYGRVYAAIRNGSLSKDVR